MIDMQKQIDSLISMNEDQHEQNEQLNIELTDLTDLHQNEISGMKNELKKLEDKLLYNFNDYWTEMVEKLDKLETRVGHIGRDSFELFSISFLDNQSRTDTSSFVRN